MNIGLKKFMMTSSNRVATTNVLAGIYRYIYIYRIKTFDVFVMILCVLDLLMPVAEIQAAKKWEFIRFYSY
jgi:hypothetical protein